MIIDRNRLIVLHIAIGQSLRDGKLIGAIENRPSPTFIGPEPIACDPFGFTRTVVVIQLALIPIPHAIGTSVNASDLHDHLPNHRWRD